MRANPERLAWRILVTAFGVFLIVCGAVAYLTYWYLFQSRVPLRVELTAARGTVRIVVPNTLEEIAVTDRRTDIEAGTDIRTDASQGVLEFLDPRTGHAVGSFVLFNDSQMVLQEATAPRFRFNQGGYIIRVDAGVGRSESYYFSPLISSVDFTVTTPHAAVHYDEPGDYVQNVTEDRTRITTLDGRAEVVDSMFGENIQIPAGFRTVVDRVPGDLPLFSAEETLLANGDFESEFAAGWSVNLDGDPQGFVYSVVFDGRTAVEFNRSQTNWPDIRLGHGESGLRQSLDLDVTDYSAIEVQATFYIAEQSLSTCGEEASECPMTIRIAYVDENGADREYIQGFYAFRDPAVDYPLACDSCRVEHIRVNQNAWYTFQSGDLLTLLPADARPAFLRDVRIYASGHAYDVFVSDIRLLAVK